MYCLLSHFSPEGVAEKNDCFTWVTAHVAKAVFDFSHGYISSGKTSLIEKEKMLTTWFLTPLKVRSSWTRVFYNKLISEDCIRKKQKQSFCFQFLGILNYYKVLEPT